MKDKWKKNGIKELAEELKKEPKKAYQYIVEDFSIVPRGIFNISDAQWDEDPIGAIRMVRFDIDGSKGFRTNYTPKELISIYEKCWQSSLQIEQIYCDKKTKYEYYDVQWKETDWGKVSGDVVFSFPKGKLLEEMEALKVDERYIKLFARLCYTMGNFIPVPKKGRGKLSVNSLHSYHRSYLKGKQWERFDKYIYDSCIGKNSKYNENYKEFTSYYGEFLLTKNYFQGSLVNDDHIIDLVTLENCDDGVFSEICTKENLERYIINICACIIIRGYKMKECL